MRSNELLLLPSLICAVCVARAIAGAPDGDHKLRPSFVAQFFHGKHVTRAQHQHPWNEYDDSSSSSSSSSGSDDEDDYKPLDTSESEDEGQTNSTAVRHSSEQQTGYDSDDEDDRDNRRRNYFLIHRAKKHQQRAKGEQRFVWHPFTPSFLINFEPYAPVSPLLLSKWSRKPNDILLVVLQQRTPPPPPAPAAASCTCDRSQNQTQAFTPSTSGDDLRKERNESSSSSSAASVVDEPHLTTADWPSSCVFAIVACCSPNNYHFRYGCFPYLGCSIALWDTEPCQLPTMIEASRQAHTYYNQLDRPRPDAENYPVDEGDVHVGSTVSTDGGDVPAAGGEGGAQSGTKPTTSTTTTTTTTISTTTTAASVTTAVPEETTAT